MISWSLLIILVFFLGTNNPNVDAVTNNQYSSFNDYNGMTQFGSETTEYSLDINLKVSANPEIFFLLVIALQLTNVQLCTTAILWLAIDNQSTLFTCKY